MAHARFISFVGEKADESVRVARNLLSHPGARP
jgi:hypothetical protein